MSANEIPPRGAREIEANGVAVLAADPITEPRTDFASAMASEPNPWGAWLVGRFAAAGMSLEEGLCWIGLAAAALLTRLWNLGVPPLNLEEGRRAMEAYALLHDGRVFYEGGPALTNLTSLVFLLFGDGDLQARLIPGICGVLLVLAPLLLRPYAGGWWSLLAGLGLLVSSTLLTASRSVSPAVPAVLCLAVTAMAAWRFGDGYDRRWLLAALTAVLIGLGTDTSFVIGLVGVILAYAIAEGEIFGKVSWWPAVSRHARWVLAISILIAVVVDTRLAMSPSGIQAGLFDPLTRWTGEVSRGAGLTGPLLLALLDGSILLLAILGLVEYRRHPRMIRFLGTWVIVAMTLASLMRMPEVRYLAMPVLPMSLLAAFGLWRLCAWLIEGGNVRATVLGLAGLVPVVTAYFQVNAGLRQNLSPWGAAGVVLVAGLLLAALLAFNLLRGVQLGAAFATWALVILALGSFAGATRALDARGEGRGQLIESTVVTRDMAYIREIALKWYRAAPEGPLPVDPSLRPLVGWALRDIPTVRYDSAAPGLPSARLLADPPTQAGPDTMTIRPIVGYVADWPSLSLQPQRIFRWLSNRETLVTLRPYAIVVVQPAGS